MTQTAFFWSGKHDTDPLNKLLAEGWVVQQGFALPYSVLLVLNRPPATPTINWPPVPSDADPKPLICFAPDGPYEVRLADQAGVTMTNGGADGITFTPGPIDTGAIQQELSDKIDQVASKAIQAGRNAVSARPSIFGMTDAELCS